jgi:hypothetical protein
MSSSRRSTGARVVGREQHHATSARRRLEREPVEVTLVDAEEVRERLEHAERRGR